MSGSSGTGSSGTAPLRDLDLASTPLERGITLVEASAGTGKTYCLTGLVLRLLLEGHVDHVGQILVVTFTNAATEELVGRIRGALRAGHDALAGGTPPEQLDPFLAALAARHGSSEGDRGTGILRDALLEFDDLLVSTIHGFCKRVLDESAFESGLPFDPELLESDDDLRLEACRDVWRRLLAEDQRGLLAGLAAARDLRPETWLDEVREVHRHPRTTILPAAVDVAEALDEASAALDALAATWSGPKMRLFLSRRRFRSGAALADAASQRRAIARVDELVAAGSGDAAAAAPDGLGGLDALRSAAVADQMLDPADELTREPAFACVDALSDAVDRLEHAVRCRMLQRVDEQLAASKRRSGVLAFDDLLRSLRDALGDPRHGPGLRRAVRETFRVALVDEFQDTDLVQYEIFRDLFSHPGAPRAPHDGREKSPMLFLVGDPKQAIYRFRGADVFAYLAAKGDADRTYTLGRNWRSSQALVGAIERIFAVDRPFVYDDIPHPRIEAAERVAGLDLDGGPHRGALQWHWLGTITSRRRAERRAVEWTAAEVAALLASEAVKIDQGSEDTGEPLRPADIAVLVRTNAQALAVQEALRAAGVPSVVSRSGDIFHTDEMEELGRVLRAVLDPGHPGTLRAACATILWGDAAADLHALADDDAAWQERVDRLLALRATWRDRGFVAMMRGWIDGAGVRERLLGLVQGERRLTNLLHGVEVLARAIHERRLSPRGLLAWLAAERRARAHDRDATELRLESDAQAVEIATIHKAKGLEYEVVVCPFLWQGRSVDRPPVTVHASSSRVVRDYGSREIERHLGMAEAERLAEDLRLVYVALTRARRRCLVAWGAFGRGADRGRPASASSALAYLLHRRQGQLGGASDGADDRQEESNPIHDAARWVEHALADACVRGDRWLDDLRRWVAEARVDEAPGTELIEVDDEHQVRWRGDQDEEVELTARSTAPGLWRRLEPWAIRSFTSLARGADERAERPDHLDPQGLDRPAGTADEADAVGVAVEPQRPGGLFPFARGPRAGLCLHDVLEQADFGAAHLGDAEQRAERRAAVETLVDDTLRRYGLADAAAHVDPPPGWRPVDAILGLLDDLTRVRLPASDAAPGPELGRVGMDQRLTEWQWWAPSDSFDGADLAAAFRRHAAGPWVAHYADRLEALGRRDLAASGRPTGFTTGFVDLAFEQNGRFYLLDWKSNHLGDAAADYDEASMGRAMDEHHYFLQYHLYAVALHRYLRRRAGRYRYDEHFGGCCYVFLRGVDPRPATPVRGQLDLFGAAEQRDPGDHGLMSPTGLFFDRPRRELIEALDAILFAEGIPERAS